MLEMALPPILQRAIEIEKIEATANYQKKEINQMENYEEENEKHNKVCKRCKQPYAASSNTSISCRFHPSLFVCRRHDDQKRYYELGPCDPPYAAKFYDCCGAEEIGAPGCTTSFHLSYDDLMMSNTPVG